MPRKPPVIKRINPETGKEERTCLDCGCWTKLVKGVPRCPKCNNIYRRKYKGNYQKSGVKIPYGAKRVELELKGEGKEENWYKGCLSEQIEAMENGDVESLLRIEKKEENANGSSR